jgi:hypothetical protein
MEIIASTKDTSTNPAKKRKSSGFHPTALVAN